MATACAFARCNIPRLARPVQTQVPAFQGGVKMPTATDGGYVRPPDAGLQVHKPMEGAYKNPLAKTADVRNETANAVSGIPSSQTARTVFVYSPAKTAMQSGVEKNHKWLLEVENPERWRNPLMGWSSTADPLSNLKLSFSSQESAIAYCERQGWNYHLSKNVTPLLGSNDRGIVKSYADVFKYKGTKRRPRKFSI
eukprot:TRINITY_DN870_c0_g1_i1.p1 TRINITY_DN870_c0_g1~~TRINITY_DN870_c0_g1_i1.p1  ORF type:complete len:196 (+),score=9.69 TRINITY_DN870_c0_g1_i1:207-794(+)